VLTEDALKKDPLLKCVKHILDFHFGDVSFKSISAFFIKSDIFDIPHAKEVLKSFKLNVLQREMSVDTIQKNFLPCIIFDDKDNPLVYLEKTKDKAIIFNPTDKKEIEVNFEALKIYKKALLIFRDTNHIKLIESNEKKSWFYEPLKANWRVYIEIATLTLFINIFALAIPLFVMNIYNRVVPNQAYETLFVLASGTFIILVFDIVLKYARSHIIEKVSKDLGLFWEEELMRKMMLIDTEHDKYMSGSKANLFKELQQVRDFFTNKSMVQIIDFPFFIIAILVIYIISPIIAIVPFLFAVIIISFNILMQKPISKLSKNSSENLQLKYSFIYESIQGTQSIKLNNATPTRMFLWRNIVAFADGIGMKIQSLHTLSMNISQFLLQLVVILVVILGVFEIAEKNLSVGALIAVTMLASRAMMPIVSLSGIVIRIKEMNESIDRIDEFMSKPTEDKQSFESGVGSLKGKVEFKNVTFSFDESKHNAIDNISFIIEPGERVGIIGQTGAGKSTLLNLLMGMYKPTTGSIYLDDHDIATIHPVEIRQNIGIMPQEPFLFNATIKENIELFRPISKEKMLEITTFVGLDDLIKKSGKGDSLQVGERGANLSVGQRHLVSLARAIATNPSMLILDEPTSGLDIGLEKKLIDRLNNSLDTQKTLLVITHRLAALELVDRILVINDGKIVADGPRDMVLNSLRNPPKGNQ
jgi:ATP-binding cassette subfamily B protein/ATP-binding cassette subfamily C protein LapB